jgi:hypothetical protein
VSRIRGRLVSEANFLNVLPFLNANFFDDVTVARDFFIPILGEVLDEGGISKDSMCDTVLTGWT